MTKREKRTAVLLCIVVGLLTILFVVLVALSNNDRPKEQEIAETSSVIASEAREDVSVPPINADVSSEISSDTATSTSSVADTSSEEISSAVPNTTVSDTSSQVNISDDSGEWNLRLVNGNYMLPDDFTPNLATISMDYARDEGMKFDARAIQYLEEMCAAAEVDGIDLLVISAYRSFSVQEGLYNNKVNYYLGQGYEVEEAMDLAATVVARPKTSEHNLGLAVDFNDVEERFDQTDAYKWLRANCADYGFIMRYDKEKEDITGVIYEPWHYRYVGKDIAKYITEKDITLEEFLGK